MKIKFNLKSKSCMLFHFPGLVGSQIPLSLNYVQPFQPNQKKSVNLAKIVFIVNIFIGNDTIIPINS